MNFAAVIVIITPDFVSERPTDRCETAETASPSFPFGPSFGRLSERERERSEHDSSSLPPISEGHDERAAKPQTLPRAVCAKSRARLKKKRDDIFGVHLRGAETRATSFPLQSRYQRSCRRLPFQEIKCNRRVACMCTRFGGALASSPPRVDVAPSVVVVVARARARTIGGARLLLHLLLLIHSLKPSEE